MSEQPVLRPEEVEGVLAGGAAPEEDGPQPYSLREPLAIPPGAREAARTTLERAVSVLNESFRSEAEIELGFDDLQQQTAAAALSVLPPPAWIAGLARPGSGGLALALPPTVGLALVDMALGGPGKLPEEAREPTQLESRVLNRLVASAAERLTTVLDATFAPVECVPGKIPSSIATDGETVAVGLLRFHIGEGDHASLLLMTAALLLPDEQPGRTGDDPRPGPLAPVLEKVGLQVCPVLRAGAVSFRDLMLAEPGKVLRLDAREDAPFELRVRGLPLARGRISKKAEGPVFAVESVRGRRPRKERRQEHGSE